ncbi:hypothetical protein ACLI4U_09910 [Natrialbaceae archaeon A-CW2]
MDSRQRTVLTLLWLAVAIVMATTLEPTIPSTLGDMARVAVVVLALFLATVYGLDPANLITRTHGLEADEEETE